MEVARVSQGQRQGTCERDAGRSKGQDGKLAFAIAVSIAIAIAIAIFWTSAHSWNGTDPIHGSELTTEIGAKTDSKHRMIPILANANATLGAHKRTIQGTGTASQSHSQSHSPGTLGTGTGRLAGTGTGTGGTGGGHASLPRKGSADTASTSDEAPPRLDFLEDGSAPHHISHLTQSHLLQDRLLFQDRCDSPQTSLMGGHSEGIDEVEESDVADSSVQKVPVLIKYAGSGEVVYVTGTFTGWRKKVQLLRSDKNEFSVVLDLAPGTHRLKFSVDGEWKCSDELPTATDSSGNFVNYIEASGEDAPLTREEKPITVEGIAFVSFPWNETDHQNIRMNKRDIQTIFHTL